MPQHRDSAGKPLQSPKHNSAGRGAGIGGLRPVQPLLLALFRRFIAKRRLRRQFLAVRLAFADRLPPGNTGKLIFYLNHPSWWDPLLCMVLAQRFIPGRNFYAPIDAEQLERYRVLRPLGLFPVEIGTVRGAAQFMRAATAVLRAGDVLGLTPQGTFTDIRTRPPAFKPGLGALMERMERAGHDVIAVPIAIEYTFWNQRLPEALVAVGHPVHTAPETGARSAATWTASLEAELAAAQDALAALSAARDERAFETLLQGQRGTAGVYGLWQRMMQCGRVDHLPILEQRSMRRIPPESEKGLPAERRAKKKFFQ